MIYKNYDELCQKTKQMPPDTDLLAFTNLYKRFGIECKISDCDEGFLIHFSSLKIDEINESMTVDEKIIGDGFFGCNVIFSKDGKFIKQEFWD